MLHVRIQLEVMCVTASVDSQGMVSVAQVCKTDDFLNISTHNLRIILMFPNNYVLDLDECADLSDNNCSSNANCTDTTGSYDCTCNVGYTGDGFTCEGVAIVYIL